MTAANLIVLSPSDNVVVANGRLEKDTPLPGGGVTADAIESGHKVAIRPIPAGAAVVKYATTRRVIVERVDKEHAH